MHVGTQAGKRYCDFVQVKEYIRRAKAWRNRMWPQDEGGEGKPSSYLMSLLVLKAYETKGHRT